MSNNLELNQGDDFIICLDISASMSATDCPQGLTRIKYATEQFKTFAAEASKYDTDGVSLYAFGMNVHAFPDVAADKIDETANKILGLSLEGGTRTDAVIQKAYDEHVTRKNEQTVAIIFTDGEPMDANAVFSTIANITNKLTNEHEFAISFVTVGNRSSNLEAFLTKLDDAIPGAKYDIVDVKKLEEVDFYKAFDGALND